MRLSRVAAAGALIFGAIPASAAVTFTMTGVVTGGFDNGYAYPGGDAPFATDAYRVDLNTLESFGMVANRSFSLVITLDESRGSLEEYIDAFRRYGELGDSPASAAITFNGVTREFGNYAASFAKAFENPDRIKARFDEERNRPLMTGAFTQVYGWLDIDLHLPAGVFNAKGFAEEANWTRTGTEAAAGVLMVSVQQTHGSPDNLIILPFRSAELDLRFDSLSVRADPDGAPAPVPEPVTWATMVLGFTLAGSVVRRARTAAGRAAA